MIILLQNGLQVEPVHTIRDKIISDELGQLIEARLERFKCNPGTFHHLLVDPDSCVDPKEGRLVNSAEGAGEEEKATVSLYRHFSVLEHTC